jgi:hypothetical protein
MWDTLKFFAVFLLLRPNKTYVILFSGKTRDPTFLKIVPSKQKGGEKDGCKAPIASRSAFRAGS